MSEPRDSRSTPPGPADAPAGAGAVGFHEASGTTGAPGSDSERDYDSDVNVRAIVWTAVGVAVMTIVSAILMGWLMAGFNRFDKRHAPARQATPQAATPQAAPPMPRLQPAPVEEMDALRAEENLLLRHAGWVDRGQGTVRLPIDVAIDLIARRGLPRAAAAGSPADLTGGGMRPVPYEPSPGTLLLAPGEGMGRIGPPAAAPASQAGGVIQDQAAPSVSPLPPPPPPQRNRTPR